MFYMPRLFPNLVQLVDTQLLLYAHKDTLISHSLSFHFFYHVNTKRTSDSTEDL